MTESALHKRRVFIVDDHPIVRHGFVRLINHESDLTVCGEASDGAEALPAILEASPDLAIIDISLTGPNGLELTKQLLKKCPDLRVLVMSMHDEDMCSERAYRAGAKGYLMKHEAMDTVLFAIRTVLEGSSYFSAQTQKQHAAAPSDEKSPVECELIRQLSDREFEVFRFIGQGYGSRQIAKTLKLSVKTVDAHREHIKTKLCIKSAAELIECAVRHALKNT
ncbi:MAG: response regulator transcription factor [Candidatus Riflebacteria bacterium]|nr:response regulator transcription factor [Candidatus Riflebacteria bacterium]